MIFAISLFCSDANAATPSAISALLVAPPWDDADREVPDRGARFAEAAGFAWGDAPVSLEGGLDERANLWRDERGGVEIEVGLGGGFIVLRDHGGYNRFAGVYADVAPEEADAVEATEALIQDLADAGFVEADQLDFGRLRVAHRQFGLDRAASDSGDQRREVLGPFVADTRITVPRVIDGVQVAGEGVEVVWGAGLSLDLVNLQWRDVESVTDVMPVVDGLAGAWERTGVADELTSDQSVHTYFGEVVYADLNLEADALYLAPVWLFVYRIDTPVGDGVIVTGKKQIAAVSVDGSVFELLPSESADLSRSDTIRSQLPEPTPANTTEEE